ncbi:MAG: DUF445 domain-containing protein [Negativicutes bacterium]|nr:DUF445 domain-containing protein [Negativicutes bacterium]
MAATNKYKATITLGLVSLGFAISYPFSNTFWGGVVASGCSAAMVGGLADWFAVSALFRRPLGIPFRTEIIPRNRERISQAIIDMVEQELLTMENICDTLNRYDMGGLLVDYFVNHGGSAHIKEFAAKLGIDALEKTNSAKISRFLAELIQAHGGKIPLAPAVAQTLTWSVSSGYFDKLLDFIIAELGLLIRQSQVKHLLTNLLGEARQVYEKDMRRRKLASQILEQLGVTAGSLAGLLQQKCGEFLGELQEQKHPLREQLRQKAADFAGRLADDPVLQARFEERKIELIAGYAGLEDQLDDWIQALLGAAKADSGKAVIRRWLDLQVDSLIATFQRNADQQQILGNLAKKALIRLVETHHAAIGTIVRERLTQLSTPALVEFIEGRVGNDLQMIRINGSVVGGLAGLLIFLLTYWWQV